MKMFIAKAVECSCSLAISPISIVAAIVIVAQSCLFVADAQEPTASPRSVRQKTGADLGEQIPWRGDGRFRLLIRVDPLELGGRSSDELPADLFLDLEASLREKNVSQLCDLSSLQVMKVEPRTGAAIPYANYAYGKSPFDRPFAWYDDAIPYEFPEFNDSVSRTAGKLAPKPRARGGAYLNCLGDNQRGRFAWMHGQQGNDVAWYAIYFDVLPKEEKPKQAPPRSWIGDGVCRFDRESLQTVQSDHVRIDVDDWDGDGLVDIIMGEDFGHVAWWPNVGTKSAPKFEFCRFIGDETDQPIDAGSGSVPKVVDWDGDGDRDLLVGTERNRVVWYENVGTDSNQKLAYRGLLMVDGKPLELPVRPLFKGEPKVFTLDYYPVLETVDWDGDGDLDLLAGGYITGCVFYYENVSPVRGTTDTKPTVPELTYRGPLEADGKVLNVESWCAAPTVADIDGDGDLDLVSGQFPMYDVGRTSELLFFENVGDRRSPQLSRKPFPVTKTLPPLSLGSPRLVDFDSDGDLDLVVSSRTEIYLFRNDGTPMSPCFSPEPGLIKSTWGPAPVWTDQLLDWNGDGRVDLVSNYVVRLNSGRGNPWSWKRSVFVMPAGVTIAHPSGIGDDWFWPFLDDFDRDGAIDVLFGDWAGHVWFHRNQGTTEKPDFDLKGIRLALVDGTPIKVGPRGDPSKAFDALQGARTVFAPADFDRDGLKDLVIGDTFGKVYLYLSVAAKSNGDGKPTQSTPPQFAAPIEIGNLGIRLLVSATDWNSDGWPDVIAGAANGKVQVFLNSADRAGDSSKRFGAGIDPHLPPIMQPRVMMGDLNGDGDEDLYIPGTQGACFVERSFLKHGYATGHVVRFEERPETK